MESSRKQPDQFEPNTYYTQSEVVSAVMEARENWDDHVYKDDSAKIAARIGTVTVLDYLPR